MKTIKILLLVIILLANLAFIWWYKRENAQAGEDEAADERFLKRILRWRYAVFALDAAYAVFSIVCIILDI